MDAARRGPLRSGMRILFGALLVISFFLLVLWRTDNPRLVSLRIALMDLVSPALTAVAGPSSDVARIFDDVQSLSELRAENERLKTELRRLRRWENDAKRLEQENAQLRALNAVALPPRFDVVTGDVVADSGGPYTQSVIVNVGREDGVVDGAPARDALGLVGRVTGVGRNSARVLLLTDPASRTPVFVAADGGRRRALMVGDNTGAPLLRYVDLDIGAAETRPVPAGSRITTSGDGGVYPRGLFIGAVAATPEGEARASLAADYGNLEFLRLYRLTGAPPDAGPSGLILPAPPAATAEGAAAPEG